LSILLLYNVGTQIERQFGSIKYAVSSHILSLGLVRVHAIVLQSYAFVSLLVTTLLELVTLLLFHRFGINHMSMGPSALIFSIIYQYSRIVPAMYKYRFFGIEFTNKSVNYFLAFQVRHALLVRGKPFMLTTREQLAISRLPASLAVMIIGLLSGQIYRSDIAGLNTYRFSPPLVRFSRRYLAPLVGSLRAPKRSNRALPDGSGDGSQTPDASQQNEEVVTTARNPPPAPRSATRELPTEEPNTPSVMREWVNELTGRIDQAGTGLRVPSDTEIAHVTSMFPSLDRAVVVAALQRR
jgi:hypothetical protein